MVKKNKTNRKRYLIRISFKDDSLIKLIFEEGGEVFLQGVKIDKAIVSFEAIVPNKLLKKLKAIKDINIDVRGGVEEIGKRKIGLVGKGDRYKDKNKN